MPLAPVPSLVGRGGVLCAAPIVPVRVLSNTLTGHMYLKCRSQVISISMGDVFRGKNCVAIGRKHLSVLHHWGFYA